MSLLERIGGALSSQTGDPGMQSPEYRTADPRELLVEDGVAVMGPAGSPVDDDARPGGESRVEDDRDGDSHGSRTNDARPSGR